MKKLIISLTAVMLLASPATASAQSFNQQGKRLDSLFNFNGQLNDRPFFNSPLQATEPLPEQLKQKVADKPTKPKTKPARHYIVVEGDNLTVIGSKYKVEWQRIWSKNKSIKHPDVIHIGEKLAIPYEGDVVANRELPAAVSLPSVTPGVSTDKSAPVQNFDGSNTYDYGYCTWYVKNRRGASLPNGLGNANTWFSRAQAMGMATGYTPKVGAVGTTTAGALGHVVYVEAVLGGGKIRISEMNAPQWGVRTERVANASEFAYIY